MEFSLLPHKSLKVYSHKFSHSDFLMVALMNFMNTLNWLEDNNIQDFGLESVMSSKNVRQMETFSQVIVISFYLHLEGIWTKDKL